MMKKSKGKVKLLLFAFLFLAVSFTRFYNIEKTTRFTRDESQNLVDIHRIFVDRDITLIGPIDGTKTIIYPSLTFYLLLPFAYLGNFEPASPAYGTAFFGILTVGLVLYLIKRINSKLLLWVGVLIIIWYPLLESSRWAWNPHLVPFFTFLAIIFYLKGGKIGKFVSGVALGLSFHLHYLSVFSFFTFAAVVFFLDIYKKRYKEAVVMPFGFFLTIIPFIYFDLKNPPGLFFNYFIKHNMFTAGAGGELLSFPQTLITNSFESLKYLTQSEHLAYILIPLLLIFFYKNLKAKSKYLVFLIPTIAQVAAISFLPTFGNRYFLLALPFFVTWLFYKRSKEILMIQKLIILLFILGSMFSLRGVLTKPIYPPGAFVVSESIHHIKGISSSRNLKNINIAVLASEDNDPLGTIYRHTALVEGVDLLLENQFEITDNLFVVSTSEETVVREDPANVMNGFRSGELVDTFNVETTDWRVYLFNRDK